MTVNEPYQLALPTVETKISMSANSLSTPISSPSTGIVSPKSEEKVIAPPTPVILSTTSKPPTDQASEEAKPDVNFDDDDDDDDENDDLFNEPENDTSSKPEDNFSKTEPDSQTVSEPAIKTDEAVLPAASLITNDQSNTTDQSKPSSEVKLTSTDSQKRELEDADKSDSAAKRPKYEESTPAITTPTIANPSTTTTESKPPASTTTSNTTDANSSDISLVKSETEAEKPLDPRDPPPGAPQVLPKHQVKFALASLRAVKRLKDAGPFIAPVDPVKLNIPTYFDIVKNPMDLSTMEKKVNESKYHKVSEFISDMDLIVSNCILFNGAESFISNMARNIKASFDKHMNNMPPYNQPAPNSISKAKKKSITGTTSSAKNSRAASTESKHTATSEKTVSSVASAAPATKGSSDFSVGSKGLLKKPSPTADSKAFALQPSGIPTIRRDSSVDGRPKREIHPPKSKDLPYGDVKPRKKKYAAELRFCGNVLKELMSKKHESFNFPFLQPVDPVALNCPSYFKVIKNPMDLGTIQEKFNSNQYETADDFEADVRLVFKNCYKFNPEGSPVNMMGHRLEALFDKKWADRPVPAPSPPPESESEEDSDVSMSELDFHDPAIKFLEEQLERMQKDLERMKKEAIQKAKEARNARKKKKKRASGVGATSSTATGGKKSGKTTANSNKDESTTGRRKSAGTGGRRASTNTKDAGVNGSLPLQQPHVTFEMKQELSEKFATLNEKKMQYVLNVIQESMPNINSNGQDEIELDIDTLDPHTVLKLYDYVVKKDKKPRATSKTNGKANGSAAQKKKGKPMSEAEQSRQIEALQKKLEQFDRLESGSASGPNLDDDINVSGGAGMASAGLSNNGMNNDESSDEDDDDGASSDSSSEEE